MLYRVEVDELRINDLAAEKLNLEMALNNIQFENKNSVKKDQFLNLSSECDTLTTLTKSNLNSVVKNLNECLKDLEIINVPTAVDQG